MQKYIGEHQPQCIIQLKEKIIISQQQINEYTIHAYLEIAEFNLWELMQKKKLSETEIDEIFDSVLDSILNLHSCNVSHGDIKPQNILFEKEKGWVLADFGCAQRYSQPFGMYLLGGTKAFFHLDLRKKLQDLKNLEQDQLLMNLFTKDIYAFQLTILFLLYPEKSLIQLQQILDDKQPTHYLVDSLYNKNYITLKQWFKSRNYKRIHQITERLIQIHHINQLKQQVFSENAPNLRQYILSEGRENIENLVQNKELQEFEYTINNNKKQKFNITRQLELCKFYLQYGEDKKVLKFYEAKLEFILGNFSNSRQIINNLNDYDYMDNDEQFLQFQILKSRLNEYWWKICDKIINSLQNVINLKEGTHVNIEWEFLLMGQLEENLRLKKKRKMSQLNQRTIMKREPLLEVQFDHCWEIKYYYNNFLEGKGSPQFSMKYIEQNFPNYYFNWMVYFLDTEYHILKHEYQQAKYSALKALNYNMDEDCIENKFRIQFHLWIAYLNLHEVNNCNQTFTTILKLAQQKDAPQLFKEYFFYFSVELQSNYTISSSIEFFKGFLEKTLQSQENLVNDNELNLFFFQMLSKYYKFEKNSVKLYQLVNSLLVKFYLNNPTSEQIIIEILEYLILSEWQLSLDNVIKNITDFKNYNFKHKDNQIKCKFLELFRYKFKKLARDELVIPKHSQLMKTDKILTNQEKFIATLESREEMNNRKYLA